MVDGPAGQPIPCYSKILVRPANYNHRSGPQTVAVRLLRIARDDFTKDEVGMLVGEHIIRGVSPNGPLEVELEMASLLDMQVLVVDRRAGLRCSFLLRLANITSQVHSWAQERSLALCLFDEESGSERGLFGSHGMWKPLDASGSSSGKKAESGRPKTADHVRRTYATDRPASASSAVWPPGGQPDTATDGSDEGGAKDERESSANRGDVVAVLGLSRFSSWIQSGQPLLSRTPSSLSRPSSRSSAYRPLSRQASTPGLSDVSV